MYVYIVEVNFGKKWEPTVYTALTQKDARFEKRRAKENMSAPVRVTKYIKARVVG